jgi:3-oxoacyl-[acyl-carrier protein] reductase
MALKGEVALVTGASRGIGRAIALELGRQGAIVAGTATSDSGAQGISSTLDEKGYAGGGYVLDVASDDSVNALINTLTARHGAVYILVNNAGITRDNLLMRMKPDEWQDVINTNLSSAYRMCKVCLRAMMKARRGRIVNIASVVAASGNPGQTNYAAAKAGLIGFTKSLAAEVGSRGITVNVVAPGFIDTDMTRALPQAQRQVLVQRVPLARLGSPEDIAAAVAFLASDTGGYITGETLHVNGGMYMT